MVTEWKITRLTDLMRITTGTRNTEDRLDGGKYPFFVRSQQIEYINDYNFDCEAVLTAGDGVGTGKVFHYVNGKFDAHQRVYVMSQFDGIDGKYFFYFFSTHFLAEVEKYTAKSSVDSVRRNMIAEMEVSLPPLPEQRAIADALSDTDAYIYALEKLISKKRSIKQGTMQELLTGKRRLPGFRGEWIDISLGDFCLIKDGTHGTYMRADKGVLFLSAKNVFDDGLHLEEESYISEHDYQQIVSCGFPKSGDILLSCVGTIGRCCIYKSNIKAAFQRSVAFIRPNADYIFNKFLMYAIKLTKTQMQLVQSANASAQSGVYLGALAKLQILCPPTKDEQTAIAEVLSDMDAEIDALTVKLNKAKHIKQGMMNDLLTGRIRLVATEPINEATNVCIEQESDSIRQVAQQQTVKRHSQEFDDAVMIAGIVNVLYSDKFPLGRKKVQKCLYLLRRHQEASTEAFKKKAAGPYADEVRYKGGEPIAKSANYINTTTCKQGTTFARGKNIEQALGYIASWGKQSDIEWVADKLKFKKVDELELLATVDMAICDLTEARTPITVESIKNLISTNAEWKEKLKKQTFNDFNIASAIKELQTLL